MSHLFVRVLSIAAFILSATAFFVVVWIVVPAVSAEVWLVSVLASEWSLGFGGLALIGVICAMFARFLSGQRGIWWKLSAAIGAAAILISLYPFGDSLRQNAPFSLGRYAAGFFPANENSPQPTTQTFLKDGAQNLQMDVYLPANPNGAGVIVVHGGSWRGGRRNDFPQWNQWLATNGYAVFDVDYRLEQPNWQTATGDVKCAVLEVKRRAEEFRIAPDRLAILGRSAGGHLALLAAYSANDAQFPANCPNSANDEKIRAVASFYAPTDLIYGYENPANELVLDGQETLRNFLGGAPTDSNEMRERYLKASPASRVNSDTPPTLLVHGGFDQLVRARHADLLAEKLQGANVSHKIIRVGYAQHGFDYNFDGFGAQITQKILLDFLNENTAPVKKP